MKSTRRHFVRGAAGLLISAAVAQALPIMQAGPRYFPAAPPVTFDYYIGPSGSDSNDGSLASPWAITSLINSNSSASTSQAQANRALLAGKSVGLLDGTYNITSGMYDGLDYDQPCLNIPGGSSGSPTVVQAVNPRMAILDGGGTTSSDGNPNGCGTIGTDTSTGYVTIDGVVVTNCFSVGMFIGYTTSPGDPGTKTPGITIKNCKVYDIAATGGAAGGNHPGIVAFQTDGMLVQNCHIYDIYSTSATTDHAESILCWGCADTVVEYCSFGTSWAGVNFKNAGNRRETVRYCYFDLSAFGTTPGPCIVYDCDDSSTDHSYFHNNVFKTYGNAFSRDLDDGDAVNGYTHIYNNTMERTSGSAGFVKLFFTSSGGIYFYNNLLARNSTSIDYRGDYNTSTGRMQTQDYNLWHDEMTGCLDSGPANTYTSLAAWVSATGKDANSIKTNTSQFVATGSEADYYKLSPGAAAEGAGKSDGTSGGTACDIGAWGGATPPTQIGANFS